MGVLFAGVSLGFDGGLAILVFLTVSVFSGGGGGKIVASIDSGGGTSGGLISIDGTAHNRATMVPCANRLKPVPHHVRGLLGAAVFFLRNGLSIHINQCLGLGGSAASMLLAMTLMRTLL